MARARYLIRFDDICPTMNWDVWDKIENRICELSLSPIMAVIPDNKDEKLHIAPPLPNFWDRVRNWQDKGWTIALHGYQHSYITTHSGIVGLNKRSEFAGLSKEEQSAKIKRAFEIFKRENVSPQAWVAPAHSFDTNTLSALSLCSLNIVSDGLSCYPYRDEDQILWIPQQLWRFRKVPFGVWTVCSHINSWDKVTLDHFLQQVELFSDQITDLSTVERIFGDRKKNFFDLLCEQAIRSSIYLKRAFQ